MESNRSPQSPKNGTYRFLKTGHLPVPENEGRPRVHGLREILNAIFFYVVRSGCAWRLLPHDFPPRKTVYHYFRFWRRAV